MKLSVVATLYQSAPYIAEFHQRASTAAKQLVGEDYEIILVNDGSPDNSLDIAVKLTETDPHVTVIDLSRNFGHHKAMMTGMSYAMGEHVFLIDIDLEEEPEWLLAFAEHMDRESCDVVYGVQEARKGGFFEKLSGKIFYRIINFLSNLNLPESPVVARLMTNAYVKALILHTESEIYIGGLMYLTGFNQHSLKVKKGYKGSTTYTFFRKLSSALNSVSSLSSKPLLYVFNIGVLVSTISFLISGKIIVEAMYFEKAVPGWTSIISSIWLVGGMLMSSVGVVGLYVAKVFNEVKRRPYIIVKNVYRNNIVPKAEI